MSNTEATERTIGWRLEAAVFICGALVMIFEINGSRIVAPFLGSSTYIWTSLIGVILAALSVGYWIGGQVADRRPDVRILAAVLFAAGGLVSITVLTNALVLTAISSLPVGLAVRSLLASSILFAPASILFGFVLPFAVKLRLLSLTESGKTVGRLYAMSTIGSIAGTFAAGFFLIPFVGSIRTLYLVAATLFVLGIVLSTFVFSRINLSCLIVFVFSVAASEAERTYRYQTNRFIDIDTEYSRLAVFDATEERTGKRIRAVANDPYFLQSAIYLENDGLVFDYMRFFHLAEALVPRIQRSLMIGGAGYSFPKEYLRTLPEAELDVVEIDPKMTEIAREHFRLPEDSRLTIFHDDARLFLRKVESQRYDVVYMDAFSTLFSVPTHLTTAEFFRDLERSMNTGGVLAMNLGGAISGDGSKFLRAELTTLREVFAHVRVFKVDPSKRDDAVQNIIIVAGNELPSEWIANRDEKLNSLLDHELFLEPAPDLPVLTDDLAPVEYYNSIALAKNY